MQRYHMLVKTVYFKVRVMRELTGHGGRGYDRGGDR